MSFAMRVTVWFEISGISKDELGHEYYCGVGDLKYMGLKISDISTDELRHVGYCVV
jgi:hypothetical protein